MTTEVPIRYRSLAGPIYDGRLLEVLGNTLERLDSFVSRVAGKRLTYKALIA